MIVDPRSVLILRFNNHKATVYIVRGRNHLNVSMYIDIFIERIQGQNDSPCLAVHLQTLILLLYFCIYIYIKIKKHTHRFINIDIYRYIHIFIFINLYRYIFI